MVALQQWVTPAAGHGVPGDAVPAALAPAVGDSVLAVVSDGSGYAKGPTGSGPGGDYPQQSVPVAGPSVPGSNGDEAELVVQPSDLTYSDPGFEQGPWPWASEPGEAYGTVPDDGVSTYSYPIGAHARQGLIGAQYSAEEHPGSNLVSQSTDTAGWQQNTPSGRTAVRQEWSQSYNGGADPFWYDSGIRHTPQRIAQTATPLNGNLAQYGGNFGAGGNLAYETPAAPATTSVSDQGSGTGDGLNQYGTW